MAFFLLVITMHLTNAEYFITVSGVIIGHRLMWQTIGGTGKGFFMMDFFHINKVAFCLHKHVHVKYLYFLKASKSNLYVGKLNICLCLASKYLLPTLVELWLDDFLL